MSVNEYNAVGYISKLWCVCACMWVDEKPRASNLGFLSDHDWNIEAHFKHHPNILVSQEYCISKTISVMGRY